MQNHVKQFMSIAGVLPERGTFDQKLTGLYIGLCLEEMAELLESQFCSVQAEKLHKYAESWKRGQFLAQKNVDALDAFADLAWVSIGGAYAMGADVQGAIDAVAHNNLSKFPQCEKCAGWRIIEENEQCPECQGKGRIVLRDENGKIMKPKKFQKVELDKFL